jgi:hypothetical protein
MSDEPGDVERRLERISRHILIRMEQELDNYTVPQLIGGLHKCLQVRLLLLALAKRAQDEEHAESAGSAVRKYSTSFKASDAAGGRARNTRGRRSVSDDDSDAAIIKLALSDRDDDE